MKLETQPSATARLSSSCNVLEQMQDKQAAMNDLKKARKLFFYQNNYSGYELVMNSIKLLKAKLGD
jgi:hypothetical protein